MSFEKKWAAVPPVSLSSNGRTDGSAPLNSSAGFYVKQRVIIGSNSTPAVEYVVNRVIGDTLYLGRIGQPILDRVDLSTYLTSDSAFVTALEQDRPIIAPNDTQRATYEEEPAVAQRVIQVDRKGQPVGSDPNNPIYVSDNPISYVKTEVTYDGDGNATRIKKYTGSLGSPVLALQQDITYDGDGNATVISRTFP